MTPNNFRVKNGLTVSNGASITGNTTVTTLAAGNTSITGFANVSTSVNSAALSVGSSFIANTSKVAIGTAVGLEANGGIGTAGQVLHSNGTSIYWAADDNAGGTVTSVATANGLSGGPITTTGTLGVTTGSTLTVNTTGIHVNSALSITSLTLAGAASGVTTLAAGNTTITGFANITGNVQISSINATSFGATLTSNTTTALLTIGNSSVSATMNNSTFSGTANNATNLGGSSLATVQGQITGNAATAYTNAIAIAANATNLTSGTVAFARLPSLFVGTTTIQSTSAAQAVSGITTLAAGNTTITGFANVSTSVNSALLTVGTSFIANTTGAYHTGTVNAASHTVGTSFIANATGTTTNVASWGSVFRASNSTNFSGIRWDDNGGTIRAGLYRYDNSDLTISIYSSNGTFQEAPVVISATTGTVTLSRLATTNGTFSGAVSGITTLAAGNTSITGFANVSTSVNSALLTVGTSFIANTTGAYHTGTVNAASHTTTGVTINATAIVPTSNSSGQTLGNSISRFVISANTIDATGAITGVNFTANSLGVYHTGTVNAASHTVGNSFIANSIGVTTTGFANIATTLAAGNTTITGDITVSGNLTINGTTTNINSTNLVVEDKNIVLADVATPTNLTADGGGITLKGATDKTFNWVNATNAWTSSEDLNLLTGKVYEIDGTTVLSGSALGTGITGSSLTSVGTLSSLTLGGAVSGITTLAAGNTTITGFVNVVSDSAQLRIGNTTNFFIGNTSGIFPASNNEGKSFGATTRRWDINAGTITMAGSLSGVTTLAAGNTSITGFANVTGNLQISTINATSWGATLTSNATTVLLTIGNSSVSSTINGSNFSGTANNASFLGGTAAASYQLNSTLSANVATLTANNSTNLGGSSLATVQGQITGNAATAYTNAIAIAANGSNITSGTVAFARLPSLFLGTTTIQSTSAPQAVSGITTLAAGNTSITGFANVSTTLQVGTNTATFGTAAFIVANGNFGVGIAAPVARLQINGSAANGTVGVEDVLVLGRALTGAVSFEQSAIFKLGRHTVAGGTYQSSSRLDIALKNDTASSDYTTANTVMTLLNNGNVGIGTTAPTQKLHVVGLINSSDGASDRSVIGWESAATYGGAGLKLINRDNSNLILGTNNTAVVTINTSGATAFTGAVSGITTLAAGNTSITGFANVSTSVNSALLTVGTSFIANTTGAYHTGTVNAASHTTTGVTINTTAIVPTSNSSGQNLGNSISRFVISANTIDTTGAINIAAGQVLKFNNDVGISRSQAAVLSIGNGTQNDSTGTISLTGGLFTGTVNAASHTVGTAFIANTSATTITDTGGVATSTRALLVQNGSWSLGVIPNTSAGSWNAQTAAGDTLIVVQGGTIGNSNLAIVPHSGGSGGFRMTTVANSTTFSITGNTSITGFANVSTSVNSALLTVGTSFIANTTGAYHTGTVNAAALTVGTSFVANTSQVTIAAGIELSANGGVGTAGQVLTSNGTSGSPYWATASTTDSTKVPLAGGTMTGALVVPANASTTGGGINFSGAGSTFIRGTSGDGASSTVTNLQLQSWFGIGFGPSITGQTVPVGENAVWIDTRLGDLSARRIITALSDVRAPIFYDSANTSFYGDFAGTSNFSGLTVTNTITGSITGNAGTATTLATARNINGVSFNGSADITVADSTKLPLAGGTMTGLIAGRTSASTDVNVANDTGSFSAMGNTTTIASMSFHRASAFAINMGLGTDNVFRIGGWSASNNCLQINSGGTVTALADFRAPIFYDSNNTAYYADPNSTSRLFGILVGDQNAYVYGVSGNHLGIRSGAAGSEKYFRFDSNGYLYGGNGGFIAEAGDIRAPIFYDQNDTTVRWDGGTFVLRGTSPTVYFRDTDHNSAMIHVNSNIFYVLRAANDSESWTTVGSGSWPLEINLTNNNAQFGGILTAITDMRAPIFYDSNDTNYYIDGAGNNRLRNLNLGGGSGFDATIHIVGIQGGNGRLTQMSPNASSQNGLNIISARDGSNADLWWAWGPNTSNVWCINSGTTLGTGGIQITTAGALTAADNITAYSDIKLKKNIELIPNALEKVLSIRGVTFERIDTGNKGTGVIAQEVQEVLPEAVMENEEGIKSVAYGNMVGLLIEAIKEQQTHINRLEEKINSIQNNRG